MKKLVLVFFVILFGSSAMAQEKRESEKAAGKEVTKEEIKQDVQVTELNGEKVVTITTLKNGVPTKEVFKGAAAEKKIADLQKEDAKDPAKREAAKKEVEKREKMAKESGTNNL